ncbi:aldehyde dehydrogenase family protein [Terriglobus sp. RCC_193]|uniref:aldehyde dehydrogenase family protein n=1 Tax=Terriglobus sp. RCC_193 TaxID=3239218 RepID=UPI003525979C
MPLQSLNPATGDTLRTFATWDEDALQARIAQAHEAATLQRALPLEHRLLCLRKLASLLDEEGVELARTITQETGKTIAASAKEVARCADTCRYYADHAVRLLAPELLPGEGEHAYVQWSPIGVVLAVLPWQSPFWHAFRFCVPVLIAGNAVLLKHAASVPQCSLQIEALVRRAGFPRGALTALLIEDSLVETALANDYVAAVSVCGTEATGRALAAKAGWQLKKSVLHLPGNDPMIVMPSADQDAAIAAVIDAIGKGDSIRRMIVHSEMYTAVMGRLIGAVESLSVGDPMREETRVGPLGTSDAVTLLEEQVKAAVTAGGRVLTGGTRMVGRGNFFEPTLLADVPRNSAVARDAFSGPVCLLFRAHDLQDAIAIANDTPLGRAASVWTKEPAEQQQLIHGVDAGFVALNALPADDPRLPVGGAKRSGYGRELGSQGIREFLVAKTVLLGK